MLSGPVQQLIPTWRAVLLRECKSTVDELVKVHHTPLYFYLCALPHVARGLAGDELEGACQEGSGRAGGSVQLYGVSPRSALRELSLSALVLSCRRRRKTALCCRRKRTRAVSKSCSVPSAKRHKTLAIACTADPTHNFIRLLQLF